VQSSRKGPRGAAKHQYKNLLPIVEGEQRRVNLAESEPNSDALDEEEYEEELEAAGVSSSSPTSSPQQLLQSASHHHRLVYEPSPVSEDSTSFYFSTAPGPLPSSPSMTEDHEQMASSPTLSFSYSSSPTSSPVTMMPPALLASEWMPPILQVVDQSTQHHCQHLPYVPLPEIDSGASSFDDIIDAYGAEAAAAAEQGVWEGEDVEAFFSITTSPYATATGYLLPPSQSFSFDADFGFVGANERREEVHFPSFAFCSFV
jgi:hypothetical protein